MFVCALWLICRGSGQVQNSINYVSDSIDYGRNISARKLGQERVPVYYSFSGSGPSLDVLEGISAGRVSNRYKNFVARQYVPQNGLNLLLGELVFLKVPP